MDGKFYDEEDLKSKKYAILYWDAEELWEYIISLHDEYDKAEKRLKFLNKEADRLFEKGIATGRYGIYETNDIKVRKCFNFGREDD